MTEKGIFTVEETVEGLVSKESTWAWCYHDGKPTFGNTHEWDTFKIHPFKIHPVKFENRLPIEVRVKGNSDSKK